MPLILEDALLRLKRNADAPQSELYKTLEFNRLLIFADFHLLTLENTPGTAPEEISSKFNQLTELLLNPKITKFKVLSADELAEFGVTDTQLGVKQSKVLNVRTHSWYQEKVRAYNKPNAELSKQATMALTELAKWTSGQHIDKDAFYSLLDRISIASSQGNYSKLLSPLIQLLNEFPDKKLRWQVADDFVKYLEGIPSDRRFALLTPHMSSKIRSESLFAKAFPSLYAHPSYGRRTSEEKLKSLRNDFLRTYRQLSLRARAGNHNEQQITQSIKTTFQEIWAQRGVYAALELSYYEESMDWELIAEVLEIPIDQAYSMIRSEVKKIFNGRSPEQLDEFLKRSEYRERPPEKTFKNLKWLDKSLYTTFTGEKNTDLLSGTREQIRNKVAGAYLNVDRNQYYQKYQNHLTATLNDIADGKSDWVISPDSKLADFALIHKEVRNRITGTTDVFKHYTDLTASLYIATAVD